MNFIVFNAHQKELLDKVREIANSKGKEYANSENRFANFERLAIELDIDLIYVAWIFATKHLDSIRYAIKHKQFEDLSEPLQMRFVDFITYLTLIEGMIWERCNPKGEPK